MKTIEIDGKSYLIDIEKATEQGLLKEKDNKPRSWEEYETTGALPDCNVSCASDYNNSDNFAYDIFNSEEEARAFCALGKLIQLRDAWYDDWKPNWSEISTKYTIVNAKGEILINTAACNSRTLTFPTEEIAIDFLKTFRDLIEQAKMFL